MFWMWLAQMKVERIRQERQVQELMKKQEKIKFDNLPRSMSSMRLQVDAKRAEEQVNFLWVLSCWFLTGVLGST